MSSEVAELKCPAGSLPNGWRIACLGDLCQINIGGTPPRHKPEYWATEGDGHPWVAISDLRQPVIVTTKERITDAGVANSNVKKVKAGTIMMSFKLTIGRVAVAGTDLFTNEAIAAFVPGSGIDATFLPYWLACIVEDADTDQAIKGATLNKQKLASLSGLLPPLEEQRRIAEVLRSVDEAIARTKVAVEQASRAIKGMLQRLFVEGIGHSDFKDGHSTSIPASWVEKPLGELSMTGITYGVVQPGPNVADGIPFVRGGDFPNGKIDIGALRKIGKDVASQYRRTELKGGEIVVSLVGYPGACALVPDELAGANIARQAALIRPCEDIVAQYLYQFLRSPIGQDRLKKETIGSAQQVINLRDLKEVIVAIPPKHEQEQIAATLADLDAFVELETANLDKLITLKGSIAIDLLSGRVRVPA